MNAKKLKIILFLPLVIFFIANLFYFSLPAQAGNDNIPKLQIPDLNIKFSPSVCKTEGGKTVCSVAWIGEYIAGIYKYAIGIVGILAAVVLMIGGVMWIIAGGSATMIGEAKSWIGASLTGLVIALCSYLILYQVNPALTVFGPLKIAQVKTVATTLTSKCEWTSIPVLLLGAADKCVAVKQSNIWKENPGKCEGNEPSGSLLSQVCCCQILSGTCQPTPSGPCAESNLQSYFGSNSYKASSICYKESSGNPLSESISDKCNNDTNNPKRSFSIGLFQINLTVHKIDVNGYNLDCPSAFSATNYNCSIINETLYSQCVTAAKDSTTNILKAKNISNGGGNWSAWTTNGICQF